MAKKIIFDTNDDVWDKVIRFKIEHHLENNNRALEEIVKKGITVAESDPRFIEQNSKIKIPYETENEIKDFHDAIPTLELKLNRPLIILHDKKTNAFYTECHLLAEYLVKNADVDAVIDPEYQEDFRANRELQPDNPDFQIMKEDAKLGRQFSDLVIEYNTNYRDKIPLKVLGGQHRVTSIKEALKENVNRYHGVRMYFNLNKDQRVEIARISNTNINVSLDLRDRMEEQRLSPPSRLRNWCHNIGILEKGKDFGDKKSRKEFIPSVRMIRTFIVNFYNGKNYKGDADNKPAMPYICKSGGMDKEYYKVFQKINSFDDEEDLTEAGKMFKKLHMMQIEKSKSSGTDASDFKLRAFNLAMIASWSFAAGFLQRHPKRLKKLYVLPEMSGSKDPLNASAMSKACHPKLDPDAYRGLGTRTDLKERGRLLQLFLLYSGSDKNTISSAMCNAAILKYHSLEADEDAKKSVKKAF